LLVDVVGLAELLGVSERQINRLDSGGKIPASIALGRCKRWSVAEVKEWIAAGIVQLASLAATVAILLHKPDRSQTAALAVHGGSRLDGTAIEQSADVNSAQSASGNPRTVASKAQPQPGASEQTLTVRSSLGLQGPSGMR
jgi:predicted DNA-binding transcriptional regulator AlpA